MRVLRKRNVNTSFICCGRGVAFDEVQSLFADIENVHFPGFINAAEIAHVMDYCDFGIVPYVNTPNFQYTISNKVVEYLAGQLPILTSIEGYMGPFLRKHGCGLVYNGGQKLADHGNGIEAVKAAKLYKAKFVVGIDISAGSIANARRLAEREGVADRCHFFVGDCENTGLPDDCIDTVLCAGVLHHLDLNHVYPELKRIMKPGGRLLAGEALNYNPIIRAYRMRTPEMRTEWEKHHILDLDDVKMAKKYFKIGSVKFWHLTSYAAAFLKKAPVLQRPALAVFNTVDRVLTKIPYLQRMAWIFTFELVKEGKA